MKSVRNTLLAREAFRSPTVAAMSACGGRGRTHTVVRPEGLATVKPPWATTAVARREKAAAE